VAGMSLTASVDAIQDEQKAQRTWDVDVQLASPRSVDDITTLVQRVPHVSRVEGWTRVKTGVAGPGQVPVTRTYPDQGHGGVAVSAVPAGSTLLSPPTLLEGRWLNPGETRSIVLNQITRASTVPSVHAGDTVQLSVGGKPTTWRVVGLIEERNGSGGAYVTAEGFADATGQPRRANQLRIVTDSHDEQTRAPVADAVNKTLTDAGIEVQSAASVSRSEAISEGHLGPVIAILLAIAVAMGVIGGIGLASTMSANILDRTREFGVMHAIGARPKSVRRIVVAEGVFLALTSCLVAAIPALALTAVMGAGLGNLFMSAPLPFRLSIVAAGIWIALVVLGAILATEASATRASRLTVREALTYL
jgi:putative ABC transport system permease protein